MKLLYNSKFLLHNFEGHLENKKRLGFFSNSPETRVVSGEQYLELCHSKEYIDLVKRVSNAGWGFLDSDTFITKESFETACYAVGASVKAAEEKSFALLRPPGHHACFDSGMGFCLFNNMAIAAKYLAKKGKRVFVIDFDLHHGNGTQELLAKEENCHYFSLHQFPAFPGTGRNSEKNCTNITLPYRIVDTTYIRQLENKLLPEIKKFQPDVIGLSAGFDSYYKDLDLLQKGAGFNLTKRSYLKIKEIISAYDCFAVLEGGYNPESIKDGVSIFIE